MLKKVLKNNKSSQKKNLHLSEIIEYKEEKFQINYEKILKHRDQLIKNIE
jgi:hypothetical protein